MDADQEPPQAFMTALVTEHFVLQGIRSTLTSESASRAALYLAALTGSLIALGFVARDATVLGPFATAVIPALLILGEFTYWRLVQGGVGPPPCVGNAADPRLLPPSRATGPGVLRRPIPGG